MQDMRETFQALIHVIYAHADTRRYQAFFLWLLREEIPSEVGHEKAYARSHRREAP